MRIRPDIKLTVHSRIPSLQLSKRDSVDSVKLRSGIAFTTISRSRRLRIQVPMMRNTASKRTKPMRESSPSLLLVLKLKFRSRENHINRLQLFTRQTKSSKRPCSSRNSEQDQHRLTMSPRVSHLSRIVPSLI